MPWNKDVDALQGMEAEAAMAFVRERFKEYEGKYLLK